MTDTEREQEETLLEKVKKPYDESSDLLEHLPFENIPGTCGTLTWSIIDANGNKIIFNTYEELIEWENTNKLWYRHDIYGNKIIFNT